MRYLRKFNESFDEMLKDLTDGDFDSWIRIEDNVKDIFVEYQDSNDLDVVVGRGFLPMTVAGLDDDIIEVKLFAQRGIRFNDILDEIDMLIDYMKSLTDKEVKIYYDLDRSGLRNWSTFDNEYQGRSNTIRMYFVECIGKVVNESLDSKIVDDIEDIFVEMHDSGLNYLVSKEGQDISIGIYRHRTMTAVIDLELLKDCVEMTRDYLSGLGDFTEFYRFGYVWNTDSQDSLRGLDSSKSRNTLEYNSFPTNLEEDLRNKTFIGSSFLTVSQFYGESQIDFNYEIDGVKIVFKKK